MQRTGVVQLNNTKDRYVVSGPGFQGVVPLNDGRYLRLMISLYFEDVGEVGRRLKVSDSTYQYQQDNPPVGRASDRWIFRYDYLRTPRSQHPGNHLQIRGTLIEDCLPNSKKSLERLHFPTMRVSLEAVIPLLAEQFKVKCNEPPKVWRRMLAESEAAFLGIAHRALSGPSEANDS
jgi:hypothetical protein